MSVDYQKTIQKQELVFSLERALLRAEEYGSKEMKDSIFELILKANEL